MTCSDACAAPDPQKIQFQQISKLCKKSFSTRRYAFRMSCIFGNQREFFYSFLETIQFASIAAIVVNIVNSWQNKFPLKLKSGVLVVQFKTKCIMIIPFEIYFKYSLELSFYFRLLSWFLVEIFRTIEPHVALMFVINELMLLCFQFDAM